MMIDEAARDSSFNFQRKWDEFSEKSKSTTIQARIRRLLKEKIKRHLEKADSSSFRVEEISQDQNKTLLSSNFSTASLDNTDDESIDVIPPGILNELVHDSDLAQLGDSLVNFLFSIALTIVMERGTGFKISDSVLAESLRQSRWWKENILILKGKKGTLGNYVESLMLIAWIERWMTLEEFVECFIKFPLPREKLHYHRTRKEALIPPVTHILDELYQRYVDSLTGSKGEINGEI